MALEQLSRQPANPHRIPALFRYPKVRQKPFRDSRGMLRGARETKGTPGRVARSSFTYGLFTDM